MILSKLEKLLLFLVLLFLPTQLGKHFWPEFSFIYSLPIDYLSPTLYFWDILVFLWGIIFLAQGKRINRVAINLYYFFILTQSLSLIFLGSHNNLNTGVGFVRLEQIAVAGFFGVLLASQKFSNIKRAIFWGVTTSIFYESFLAIAQFIKGGTVGFWILGERTFSISSAGIAKFDFYGDQFLRPYATFPHPNVLAGFMVISFVVLSLFKELVKENNSLGRFLKINIFLCVLVIILTVSRTTLIALLISSIALVKKRGRIVIIILILALFPLLYIRFSSLLNFDNLTLIRREELFLVALKLWSSSPFFGIGLNNFIPAASNLFLTGPSRFLQPVHNIFLLVLSETGIVGLVGISILLGYPIFKLWKLPLKPYPLKPILLIWGIIFFLGMFDHYFLTLPQGYRMLFFVWGLSFSMLE